MSSDKLRAAGHSEQVVQAIESHRQATQAQANQQAGNGMQVNMAMSSRLSKPTPEQLKNSHMLVQRWRDEALVKLSKTPICFYRGHV